MPRAWSTGGVYEPISNAAAGLRLGGLLALTIASGKSTPTGASSIAEVWLIALEQLSYTPLSGAACAMVTHDCQTEHTRQANSGTAMSAALRAPMLQCHAHDRLLHAEMQRCPNVRRDQGDSGVAVSWCLSITKM